MLARRRAGSPLETTCRPRGTVMCTSMPGLVVRVVVGGEPPRRHVRLVHGHDLAPVGEPVALAERSRSRPGWPAYVHDHVERSCRAGCARPGGSAARGGSGLWNAARRPSTVTRETCSSKSRLNAVEVLGGADREPGPAGEPAAARSRSGRGWRSGGRRSRRCRPAGSRGRRSPGPRAARAGPGPRSRRPARRRRRARPGRGRGGRGARQGGGAWTSRRSSVDRRSRRSDRA